MGRTAFFSFLLLSLVAVSVRLAEAQDGQCPPGVNLLRTCRCETDGFGICWNQKCDLCDLVFRKRPGGPLRGRRCNPSCGRGCTCSRSGRTCCCLWTTSRDCRMG